MITLKLTDSELAILGTALGKMPYESVAALIANVGAQVREQYAKKEADQQNGQATKEQSADETVTQLRKPGL